MKLIHEKFERDGKGSVKCTPETEDDMWDLYNLLKLDDIVHATATRKVKASEMEASSGGNGTRDTSSKVIKLTLGVKVTNVYVNALLNPNTILIWNQTSNLEKYKKKKW